MSTARRIEQILGIVAAIWGIFILALALFGPLYQTAASTATGATQTGRASAVSAGLRPITVIILAIILVSLVGIAVTAIQDGRGIAGFRVWLRTFTIFLAVVCLVAILSIGVLLLPSLIVAVIASVLAGTGHQSPAQST